MTSRSSSEKQDSSSSVGTHAKEGENAAHFYHIGDVATLTGLSADALRAWERVGLLTPHRSAAGVRRYTEDDLARIRLIARTLQQGGYSRRAVAKLLQFGDLRPDAADYAPGPARLHRSRRGGNRGRASRRSDTGAQGDAGISSEYPGRDQDEQDEARSERLTLDAVARINDALASGRALADVLEVICGEACRAFGVSDSVLWLPDYPPSPQEILPDVPRESVRKIGAQRFGQPAIVPLTLVAAASYGPHATAMPHAVPLDDRHALVVQAFHSQRGMISNSLDASSLAHSELSHLKLGAVVTDAALLVVPLLATNNTAIGVLSLMEVLDPERFDSDDLERVRLFAVQATLAIETARLHADLREAREQAEEHRARWQAAVDDLPALVCICDSSQSITYVSPTCTQVLGWPDVIADPVMPAESWVARCGFFWLGEPDASVVVTDSLTGVGGTGRIFSELAARGELPLPRALQENQAVHAITVAHRCPDGMERLVSWDAAPMRTAQGQLRGAVAVGHDVTQEHRQHEREACLAAVTHAAAGALDPHGIESRANQILTALVTHTRKPVISATLYLLDEETDILRRVGVFGVEQSGTHAPALPLSRQHPWWHLLIGGAVYSSPDGAQPRWLRAIGLVVWRASSIRAWATVPLRAGEKLVGALSLGLSVPHVWDAAERAWLEACADAVMMGVENDRLFAAAQQRSRALEALLAAADDTSSPTGEAGAGR